jgi:hypothetical protein
MPLPYRVCAIFKGLDKLKFVLLCCLQTVFKIAKSNGGQIGSFMLYFNVMIYVLSKTKGATRKWVN